MSGTSADQISSWPAFQTNPRTSSLNPRAKKSAFLKPRVTLQSLPHESLQRASETSACYSAGSSRLPLLFFQRPDLDRRNLSRLEVSVVIPATSGIPTGHFATADSFEEIIPRPLAPLVKHELLRVKSASQEPLPIFSCVLVRAKQRGILLPKSVT